MTDEQRAALAALCERYKVPFDEHDYTAQFDLPEGYVAGWIGGGAHGLRRVPIGRDFEWQRHAGTTIYVGCDPEGRISS